MPTSRALPELCEGALPPAWPPAPKGELVPKSPPGRLPPALGECELPKGVLENPPPVLGEGELPPRMTPSPKSLLLENGEDELPLKEPAASSQQPGAGAGACI